MKKLFRKTTCFILAAWMILLTPVAALADNDPAEPADLPGAESPMIYNSTDSSNLSGYSESDVHGFVNTEGADEIESLISDEAREQFAEEVDRIAGFEPVDDADVSKVLGNVESFLSGGGLKNYLQNGTLLQGASLGLVGNKEDKVRVLGTDANASSWIFVVEKDAMSWFVKDEEGMGIPNALVTLSFINDAGKRVTKSVVATAGNTPGIAVFDELPDDFYGIVDIQAEGYRAVSILDKLMHSGDHYTMILQEAEENELYIRGVDLSGKDMVNEETKLSLVSKDTEDLTLKVLVSRTGNAEFPGSIEIYSENREKSVLSISGADSYEYDSNTRIYTAPKRWAEQNAGLLAANDCVSIHYGGNSFELTHLTVEKAVLDPGVGNTDLPITTKPLPGNVSDRMGGAGWINITAQILQVPVTFGVFPDGSMIFMASYDMTKLAPDVQTKYSSLFEKSWNPKSYESLSHPLEVFERSFWENAEKVKGGKEVLNSKDKVKCLTNKTLDFSLNFSLFLRSAYNETTDDWYGVGGFMFSGSLQAGVTEYFLIPAGPVVVPVYIGLEAGIAVNTSLSVNFCMDTPPKGREKDYNWKYATDDGVDVNARIEVVINFGVFGGVGVKGVLGAAAVGYVNFDIATLLGKGKASLLDRDPHSFIDVLYGLRIDYYLLFFSGSIKFDCLNGKKRLSDSWGETDALSADHTELSFTDLSLEACADQLIPQLSQDGGNHDAYFLPAEEEPLLEGRSDTVSIDSSTYPDTQLQFAATKNYTALFRLASTGSRTDIYYQLQSRETGNLMSGLYRVALPAGETRSVSEFVVVPNKTDGNDPENCDKVYIGAILADNTLKDEAERMKSTDVAAIVVDLDETRTTSSVIASDSASKGQYLYSAPMPAGRADYCSVAYAATGLRDDNGTPVTRLNSLMGMITTATYYYVSYCEAGSPEKRYYKNLGRNKVHSSGVIAPNEPSYWMADPLRSSDKWLVVRGYGANGYYSEDLKCNFRIDIDGMVDPADIREGTVSYDTIITNWQYLNGCNYFIAGDSVYWMNKKAKGNDPADYEWVVEKAENGSGVLSVDNRYALITNNNQSAIYLIGVVGDYDVDMEESEAVKSSNRAQIYTLTVDPASDGGSTCTLHGPLSLKFAAGDPISCFTAAYNPDDCASSGLTIAYSTPVADEGSIYACRLRMWKQNADKGLLVTNVKIPDYLVIEGQPYIETYVTVRNYGYGRENPVPYTFHDENGVWLNQTIAGEDVGEVFYTGKDLYTGDSRVDRVLIRPNPGWALNEEHEIFVEVAGSYRYNGDLDDVVNGVKMKADNISLSAKNTLIGGKHYVQISVANNTLVSERMPKILATFKYGSGDREKTMTFSLPTRELLKRAEGENGELTDQTYHYDIDLDRIWEDGLKDDLIGISFSLVDDEGNVRSNGEAYVENPESKHSEGFKGSFNAPKENEASKDGRNPSDGIPFWVWIAVGGGAVLLALILFFLLRRKKAPEKEN